MPAFVPVVTQIWSSTVAQDGYLIVRGKIQSQDKITGVMSCAQITLEIFDTTTYRNELSAAYIGRPWANFASELVENTAGTGLLQANGVFSYVGGVPVQNQDTVTENDDQFNAVEPFSTPKQLSYFTLWSGANGTGNVLAFWRADEHTEFSIAKSSNIF